jgi:hypothetical protein
MIRTSIRLLLAVAFAVFVAACTKGGGGTNALPQTSAYAPTSAIPAAPSGIITVTPASTRRHPFAIHCIPGVACHQKFVVSELRYKGQFTFDVTKYAIHTITYRKAGTSFWLRGFWWMFYQYHCGSFKVVVHDALGNTARVYATTKLSGTHCLRG